MYKENVGSRGNKYRPGIKWKKFPFFLDRLLTGISEEKIQIKTETEIEIKIKIKTQHQKLEKIMKFFTLYLHRDYWY